MCLVVPACANHAAERDVDDRTQHPRHARPARPCVDHLAREQAQVAEGNTGKTCFTDVLFLNTLIWSHLLANLLTILPYFIHVWPFKSTQ